MSQKKIQRENSCTVAMNGFKSRRLCTVSTPTQCWASHKWQRQPQRSESEQSLLTATTHCSAGLAPTLAAQGYQATEAGDVFGHHPHQEPVQVKGFIPQCSFSSPSCSQPVQELVPHPSPLSHPSLVQFQSIGKVSWTHLGIGIWKIELIQTVFPCIQETSDC